MGVAVTGGLTDEAAAARRALAARARVLRAETGAPQIGDGDWVPHYVDRAQPDQLTDLGRATRALLALDAAIASEDWAQAAFVFDRIRPHLPETAARGPQWPTERLSAPRRPRVPGNPRTAALAHTPALAERTSR